ncbi:EXS (ERD1/XPR1/SYG1) family protein [Zea mays]|uniref:EXS (ERD1/XPR1/SYG1) family protein n=1 Tax=Zea mays TaxID=4577 RepID=A0A1D6KF61_MAIZE|nr:EXS (ERD1/XPR1/SYG1) family protein [Zea mays]
MKGSTIPSVAIMPSPLFLWRFKVVLFLLWGLCCCKIGWDSVMRMSVDLRDLFLYEAFLYYNPLLLVALMIWLWGVNLWVFAQSSVNYAKVFDLAQTHLSHREIWRVLLYAILLMILLSPFDMFYLSSRFYFLRTVWRIILPLQAITFPDFFLADIFTSMSKVFSDLERSVCRMVNRQETYMFTSIPVSGITCHFYILNSALKYSTAIPVIFLSALKYHVYPDQWVGFYRPLWLISSVVNSLYSFYWDIKRDWDLRFVASLHDDFTICSAFHTSILLLLTSFDLHTCSILTRIFMFKNPSIWTNLLYGQNWVFYWVLGSNLVLRCTWTYKLSAHLRHNYLTVFTIAALEILRRWQWVFFRVENEWNKMTAKQNLEMSSDMPSEGDRLLDSSNHTV